MTNEEKLIKKAKDLGWSWAIWFDEVHLFNHTTEEEANFRGNWKVKNALDFLTVWERK